MIAPSNAPRITFGSTMFWLIMPAPTAFATATLPVNSAAKLKNAAHSTAAKGLRTRVPTIVAMEFAESWKPLLKSKMNAIAMIAMTYQTTGKGSGVLDGNAVHRVRYAHALIDRDLQRFVHLLPPDHLDGVRRPSEKRTHRLVVQRVPFLLELLDLRRLDRDLARTLDGAHRLRDVLRGAEDDVRHLLRRLAHLV